MVEKGRRLIPNALRASESFQRDFRELVSLTARQIDRLAAIAESKDGFNLSEESLDRVAAELGLQAQEVGRILRVASYLYAGASETRTYEENAEEVCEFAKSIGIKDCDDKISAIQRLLTKKEKYEHAMLVGYSETMSAPTISDVDVACDVRAVVDPRSNDIVDYIPIALVGIEVEKSPSEKRTITLQMSEEVLDLFVDDLNKAKRVLESLRKKFSGKNHAV